MIKWQVTTRPAELGGTTRIELAKRQALLEKIKTARGLGVGNETPFLVGKADTARLLNMVEGF